MIHLAEAGTVLTIISLAVAVAGAVGSYVLARRAKKPNNNTAAEDFSLTTIVSQGAAIPLLIGKRRIGPKVGWAGDRVRIVLSQRVKKNKGLLFTHGVPAIVGHFENTTRKATGEVLYSEAAWHCLCIGPAERLHRIWVGGELVFPGSGYSTYLDRVTHPSGTTIAIGTGEFRIFWGEPDQPVNTFLGDASRVGVASRWPHVCYIEWTRFGLNTSPSWPQVEYEVEVRPYITTAVTTAEASVSKWLTRPAAGGLVAYEGANPGYALSQILHEEFPHGIALPLADFDFAAGVGGGGDEVLSRFYELPVTVYTNGFQNFVGNPAGDPASTDAGTYALDHTAPEYSGGGLNEGNNWAGFYVQEGSESGYIDRMHVYLTGPGAQQVTLYDAELGDFYDGTSFDSVVPPTDWFFDEFLGMFYREFPIDEVELDADGVWELYIYFEVTFDNNPNESISPLGQATLTTLPNPPTGSLYEFIQLAETEGQAASVILNDGDEAETAIGVILQDCGMFMPMMCNGKLGFVPIRDTAPEDLIVIDQDQVLPPVAEVERVHADQHLDRVIFSFSDVERNFRETTVKVDEDGQPARTGAARGSVVGLNTVIDHRVASFVAERRSQEELARGARFLLNLARGMHRVLPGRVITVPGFAYGLRVMAVTLSAESDAARVECLVDYYGAAPSNFSHPAYDSDGQLSDPAEENLYEDFWEIPEHGGDNGVVLIAPLAIRAGEQVIAQLVHLSSDGASYDYEGSSAAPTAGGPLLQALPADTTWVIEQGPQFTLASPEDDLLEHFEDLATDHAAWRSGRQLAVIGSELFYVRKVTAISAGTYRLDGLIRARLDTLKASHAISDVVYLFTVYNIDTFGGQKLYPGANLYLKQQPVSSVGPFSLASVTPTNKTITGKGLRPMRPDGFRVVAPRVQVPAYETGEDITLRWGYRSTENPGTGAGLQPFGSPTGISAVRGTFQVEVYDTGDTLVETYEVGAVSEWTYTNANLQADLGGETDFYLLLRNTNGSLRSDYARLDIEAL